MNIQNVQSSKHYKPLLKPTWAIKLTWTSDCTNLIRLLHKQRRQKQPEFTSSCSTLHVWLGRDNTELNPLRIIISRWERMTSILTGLYSNTCFHLVYMNTYFYCKWMQKTYNLLHRNATDFQVWKRLMLRFSWLRIPNKENPKTRETHKFFLNIWFVIRQPEWGLPLLSKSEL